MAASGATLFIAGEDSLVEGFGSQGLKLLNLAWHCGSSQ